jgi:Trk K+ transport system NAD-binding subunit
VVLRMFDEDIANKLRDAFKLDIAFSSAAAAAPIVAASVLDLDILGSFTLDGRELFTARMTLGAGSALVGCTVADIGIKHRVMVLSRKPDAAPQKFNPPESEVLQAGDQLVAHGELDTLRLFGRLASRSQQ